MKLKTSALCAVLFGTTCVSPAWALPTLWGDIDLTTMRFSLVDTDANDGITASFSSSFTGRSVNACLDPGVLGCTAGSMDPLQPISMTQQENGLIVSGNAGPAGLHAEAEGVVRTELWGVTVNNLEHFTFSGAGRFTAEVDYAIGGVDFFETLGMVQAYLGMSSLGSFYDAQQLDFGPQSTFGGRNGTLSVTMDVVDGQVSGMSTYVWARIDGAADPMATPIPEPETWAMLLAGAGLVGVGARRRRR